MNLTPHFTLEELTISQEAVRRGLSNKPNIAELANLRRLAETLEKVRSLVGRPVVVSSGFRSLAVNRAIGSGDSSAHVKGLAADFTVPGMTVKALCLLIRESGIVYDQLIYEGTWAHLGLSEGKPRSEELTAHFSRTGTTYTRGIA
jgi:zinc D-Ala-D-Ala carboxypeptidase